MNAAANGTVPRLDIATLTRDEKRGLLERLLRDLLGDDPQGEWGVYNADGSCYLHLLSPHVRAALDATPERIAQWEQEALSGNGVPLGETAARMKAGTLAQSAS